MPCQWGLKFFFLIFDFLKTDHLTKKRSFHNSLPTQYTCTLFFELYVEKQERTMFNKILIMIRNGSLLLYTRISEIGREL